MDWKEFSVKFGDTKQYLAMSEQSSQEREIERPFLETKRILAGTAAAAVQASSVSVSPGSGDWGPSPACTARHRLEQRQKLDRQRGESLTQHVRWQQGPRQQLVSFLEIYISRVHHRAILYDIHVREGRSVVSSPALWTMQTPRSEEIQSSRESGHPVWWRH